MHMRRITVFVFVGALMACLGALRHGKMQSSGLRRITNTTEEGINLNPSISGDGRIVAFESTEDVTGVGGSDHFRAIQANIGVDPATFFQLAGTRAVAPAISRDGSHIAFASKDDPLGINPDGNSEIFLFDGAKLIQVTNTSPGSLGDRVTNGSFQPSISDDGRFIAFSSNRDLTSQNADENLEVFVYDASTSTFSQLTNSTGIVGFTDAKISGDGSTVAFIRDPGTSLSTARDLVKQSRIGPGSLTLLASSVQSLAVTYGRAISDDGLRVVYSAQTATNTTQVFLFDGRAGGVNRQITTLGSRVTEVPLHPTISGDGSRIAFSARRSVPGATSNSDGGVELYVYDLPTSAFSKITNAPSSATADVVSSLNDDGSIVAFSFPRILSGAVTNSGTENNSEIYVAGPPTRPANGTLSAILNDASFGREPSTVKAVAPNSIAAAQGTNLANTTLQSSRLPDGTFPTNVAGTRVTVNGRAAQIFFVSPTQVNFLVPPQTEIGAAEVIVTNAENFPSRGTVPTLLAAPGIFTKTGDGIGESLILDSDTLQEGPFDPTSGNLRLSIFTTGARNAIQTTVSIGGRIVRAESIIPSSTMPGLDEVHVLVPSDLRGAGTVNLTINSDGRDSNPVTVNFLGDSSRAILFNEVLADPPTGDAGDANHDGVRDGTQDEFVELVNGSANETIGMSGWTIKTRATGSTTETTRFTFPSGTSLPAGESALIFGGGTFNPTDTVFGCAQVLKATSASSGLSLSNTGLTILVRDSAGKLITQFSYGGSTGLDGNSSQSLTRSPEITGSFVLHTAAPDANGRKFSPGLRTDGTPFGNCPGKVTSVSLTPASTSIVVGQTTQFTAKVLDQYGRTMTGISISFASDNTDVATIDSSSTTAGVATVTVRSRNPGTAHITATATDGTTTVNSPQSTLTVTGPSLSINDISLNEGNSGTTTFTFTVSLSTPAPAPVTFDIATQDNTATAADNDYVARSLTAQTIPTGQQTYSFDVTVNGDLKMEQSETFFVDVTNVTGASVTDGRGVGTIVSDDIPLLSVNDVSLNEGNSGATTFAFTISSSMPAPAGGITFDIATADGTATAGSDYVARSLTGQTIPAGQTTYTFNVNVNGDSLIEPNETFLVNISNVSSNAGIADGQGQGTIQNDDLPLLVISQVYGGGDNSGAPFRNDFIELYNRGTTTVDFSITPYSVQYAGVGSNFSSSNKTNLTAGSIAPGEYFLIQEAGGTTNGVALPTPDATGSISMGSTSGKVALVAGTTALAAATCPGDDGTTPFNSSNSSIADLVGYGNSATTSGHCYEGAGPAAAPSNTTADFRKAGGCVDTNENGADFFTASPNPRNSSSPIGDCKPDITINDVTVTEGNTGTVNATFTVTLSSASANTVAVDYATADGTATAPADYQSASATVTFDPGDLTKTITVLVNGDTLDEPNETFFVNLTNATNGSIVDNQGQGTINDNDAAPSLSINDASTSEGDSGTTSLVFNVSLSTASGQAVTVNYATADNSATAPTDYQSTSGMLTFNPGDTAKTITVLVNGDTTFEQNETFFVNLTSPVNASISDAQGIGTVTNDDAAPPTPTLFINDVSVAEGNSGTSTVTFTVTLTPSSSGTVTVNYATANGTATTAGNDYQSASGQLTFNPGDTTKTFDVTINGDTLVEPDETFTVGLSGASGAGIGTPNGTGTIQNDDTPLLVVSQVYPGGGLTGASFTNDYIELFNRGTTTVDFSVTPFSVEFLSTGGSTWAKTDLTAGTMEPRHYFLVKEFSTGAVGAVLPTADATGNINITSTTPGKVALVQGATLLTDSCPGDDGSQPFNPAGGSIVDLVGYLGTASTANHCYEGTGPAPFSSGDNTIADFRKFGGCQDTNDNAANFGTATPNPRNSSSPVNDCTAADLEITETDSPDPVIVGSNVTYTITVTNLGAATANSVVVTDNLPANVTFVSCGSTGTGACNGSGNNRTVSYTSLAAAASETITIVATANGPAGMQITNSATVSSSTSDPNAANNSATATTDVTNPTSADLSILKSDSPDPVFPTQTLTYTLSVTNSGPDTAQTVVVTDTLPAEVTFVDCASNQGGVCAGTATSPTITFASLANGVTATITIHVTVNGNVTSGTIITNSASVTSATADSNPGNNTDSEDTTIQELNAGQLLISEFRTRGPSGASDEFVEIYNPTTTTLSIGGVKIRASNGAGTVSDRVNITASTTLGPGCHYLIANSSASGYSGGTPPNQTYTTGIADDGGIAITRANGTTIIDQVGMSSGSAYKEGTTLTPLSASVEQSYERKPGRAFGNGTDTNNNSADFFLNASSSNPENSSTGCINTSAADLSITKSDSPDPVITGANVTYTIVASNNGPAAAQSVLVTDNLPANLTFVSCASTGSGLCGGSSNNRTVTFSSLAMNASETITLVATANGPAGTPISNSATVSSSTTDVTPGNNTATATTAVSNPAAAELSLSKVSDTAAPVVGQNVVFTLTLTNNGPDTAVGVQVTDLLPSGLTFVSSTPSQGTYDNGNGIWNIGGVNNGAAPTLAITARVTSQGSKTNTATITASGATDSNTSNNQSSVTFAPALPQLVISQLYTSGGASSALYNRDYIEIFNRGTVAINLSGFSVQYAATGTSTFTVIASLPNASLAPRQYYLISAGTTNSSVGANLPVSADVTGTSTNMTGSVGKVAIVFGTSALTSSNVSNPPLTVGNPSPGCPTNNTIVVDFIGYGTTAACYEGTGPAPDPTATNNSQADFRGNGGCTDTDNNASDFARANALPRNSSTIKASCP